MQVIVDVKGSNATLTKSFSRPTYIKCYALLSRLIGYGHVPILAGGENNPCPNWFTAKIMMRMRSVDEQIDDKSSSSREQFR